MSDTSILVTGEPELSKTRTFRWGLDSRSIWLGLGKHWDLVKKNITLWVSCQLITYWYYVRDLSYVTYKTYYITTLVNWNKSPLTYGFISGTWTVVTWNSFLHILLHLRSFFAAVIITTATWGHRQTTNVYMGCNKRFSQFTCMTIFLK